MKPTSFIAVAALLIGIALLPQGVRAQAPPPTPTIWSFFGIPQGMNKLHGTLFNRRGNHPKLEKKPPLKSLADPANLESPDPAIKKAAEVKQAEDLAPQKIKAVKYLAEIGCGCHNIDNSITDALVAAMGDCTEDVRLATIEAMADAAESGRCEKCYEKSCCSEDISKKLAEIAFERDDHGCWLEPSERVREAAREALSVCCSGDAPVIIEDDQPKRETVPDKKERISDEAPMPPMATNTTVNGQGNLVSSRRRYQTSSQFTVLTRDPSTSGDTGSAARRGMTVYIDEASRTAQIQFPNTREQVQVGQKLRVFARTAAGFRPLGQLEVIESSPGTAQVRPIGDLKVSQIGPGVVFAR